MGITLDFYDSFIFNSFADKEFLLLLSNYWMIIILVAFYSVIGLIGLSFNIFY